jgi:hypothetical protein
MGWFNPNIKNKILDHNDEDRIFASKKCYCQDEEGRALKRNHKRFDAQGNKKRVHICYADRDGFTAREKLYRDMARAILK